MNNHSPSQPYFASLEENLTNSIRRAKEKIYHHSLTTYPLSSEFSQESQHHQTLYQPYPENRNRTASQRVSTHSATGKEEGSALAAAMKNLQDRIATLEREKSQMRLKNQSSQESMQRPGSTEREQMEKDMARLVTALRDKQQEVKRLNRVNSDLSSKNTDLLQRVLELEEELQRSRRTPKNLDIKHLGQQQPKVQKTTSAQTHQENIIDAKTKAIITQKDLRIVQLSDQLKQWESRNALSHQTIEKLMRQLQEEKKTNLRWIKLHEEQLKKEPQKQNNNIDANRTDIKAKPRQPERKDYGQILRANKQMHDTLQRNKNKISDLTREMQQYSQTRKQAEQRYAKLKLLVCEMVDNVNKMMPHPNAHLRFLMNRIEKLDNIHLQSLRSLSNHSRRSLPRNSNSKQRKKSLKMSDLNSSSKKSHDRSAGKSSRNRKVIEQLSHSEKKPRLMSDQELELQRLEREVAGLRRQHRNLVVRAEKNSNGDPEVNAKIQETTLLYVEKKNRLEQLRRNGGQGIPQKQLLVLE